ncbi:MAG: electron transport complex protein RnfC [Firmicutes bacterium]|nr:electron transport complex protein RnfC [Bacillota bacterium]
MEVSINTLLSKVKDAGVVGAGGAGFPTHVKLAGEVDTIVINGAECEPLLDVDIQLLENEAESLLTGLELLVRILGAKEGIVALKAKHEKAKERLREVLAGKDKASKLRLHLLDDFYPVGDEPILLYEVVGKVVPEGNIPLVLKCLVINVETLKNIIRAIDGKPVITTCVTVAGRVKEPGTFEIPVGASIKWLLEAVGGADLDDYGVMVGGPMTGTVLSKAEVEQNTSKPGHMPVITKTTKAVLVLPADHSIFRHHALNIGVVLQRAQSACCQCRLCTDLCPRYLLGYEIEPHLALNRINHGQTQDPAAITHAFLCSDCGVCELYACPVGLSPRRIYQAFKEELLKQGVANPHIKAKPPKGPREAWAGRHIPTNQLLLRLGLGGYEQKAPWRQLKVLPSRVTIPLKQHVGVPAEPLVQKGEIVEAGQLIGEPPVSALGASIHSSINGRISEVTEKAVVIQIDG